MRNPPPLETNTTLRERLGELDYIGPGIFVPAVVCLLLALQLGGTRVAWKSAAPITLIMIFGILIPVWVYSQYWLGERATVPIRVMRQRTVFFACFFSFFGGAAFIFLTIYIPLYFQAVQGTSAVRSGVDMLPLVLTATASSLIGGFLITIIGYYSLFMIVGMAIFTVGAGLLTTLGVDTTVGKWIGYQLLCGIGMGVNLQVPRSRFQY